MEERILNIVVDNALISSRTVGCVLSVNHAIVFKALIVDRMHPYHLQRVQAITPSTS